MQGGGHYFKSHKIIIIQPITTVIRIYYIVPRGNQRNFGFGSFSLLGSLVGCALLPHLFVAHGGQSTGNLLDFGARKFLDELLGEILSPQREVRFLRVSREQRNEGGGELGELVLSGGLEERHRREVDRLCRIRRITHNHGPGGSAVSVEVDVTEEILRVLEIRVLLRFAQARSSLRLVLVVFTVFAVFAGLGPSPPLFLVLFYPLRLAFLIRRCLGLRFGFGRRGLGCLFPLYLGVFGGVPGIKNLVVDHIVISNLLA